MAASPPAHCDPAGILRWFKSADALVSSPSSRSTRCAEPTYFDYATFGCPLHGRYLVLNSPTNSTQPTLPKPSTGPARSGLTGSAAARGEGDAPSGVSVIGNDLTILGEKITIIRSLPI